MEKREANLSASQIVTPLKKGENFTKEIANSVLK